MEIKEKILSLIPRKQEVREIKVPDLKQYLIDGYKEIRQVKQEKIELENKLEEEKKNKQLYDGALVTLDEFRRRDEDNNKEILRLKEKIEDKQKEIDILNSELNTYKIKQHEYDKKEDNMNKAIEEEKQKAIDNFKKSLCYKITHRKGNLSKDTIVNIINNT